MSYTTEVMSIRTGSDNRYTIEPFVIHRSESSQSMERRRC